MLYMAGSDPEMGENACVLMPINYLGNIRNLGKGLLNIMKLVHLKHKPNCCKHCLQCKVNVF